MYEMVPGGNVPVSKPWTWGGHGGTACHIFNISTRWRWVVRLLL